MGKHKPPIHPTEDRAIRAMGYRTNYRELDDRHVVGGRRVETAIDVSARIRHDAAPVLKRILDRRELQYNRWVAFNRPVSSGVVKDTTAEDIALFMGGIDLLIQQKEED